MFSCFNLGKTRVPHLKHTASMKPIELQMPSEVLLPVSQHIGAPAKPIVKAGDTVKLGQKIAEAQGEVSSPIHASVSGTVKKIEEILLFDGRRVPAIRIENDKLMTVSEEVAVPSITSLDELIEAVRESGVVGLGGAGFPTAKKLSALSHGGIDTLIINGAECEPYITGDTRAMLDEAEWLRYGIELFAKYIPTLKFIFGIENNKKSSIALMKRTFVDMSAVSVRALPSKYPQGAEKVLIYNTTKRVVPEGKLPADVGVLVMNVTTLLSVAKYIKTGMPLVSRTVTLDGSAVASPKNVIVPIGTTLSELIELGGGLKSEAGKVILGGPMMGGAVASLDEPVIKTTGAVTVLSVEDSTEKEETACIHCGRCVETCPHLLNPVELSRALTIDSKQEKIKRLEELKVMLCIECGSCSYVCPAKRPLVQNNRLAKGELRAHYAHQANLKK